MTKHQKHNVVNAAWIQRLLEQIRQAQNDRYQLWRQKRILTVALEQIQDWCECREGECPSAIAYKALQESSKEAHPSGQPST